MALVGIYDYDMLNFGKFIPSLDLMKYSAYHKRKNDTVNFLYHFDEEALKSYDIVYVRVDKNSKIPPPNICSHPKVEWVGKRFFDNSYIQLRPEVEKCRPDQSIYVPFCKEIAEKVNNDRHLLLNAIVSTGTPCRITYNGELVNSPMLIDEKELIIYDDINCFSTKEIRKVLDKNFGANLTFVERIHVPDFEDYKYLRENFKVKKRNNHIYFTGDIDDPKVDFKKNYPLFKNQFRILMPVLYSDEEIINYFINCSNKVYYAVARDIIPYFISNPKNSYLKWNPLLNGFSTFLTNAGKTTNTCFYQYARTRLHKLYDMLENPDNKEIVDKIRPLLMVNLREIHTSGEWDY